METIKSTYKTEDCIFLLKDLTGVIEPTPFEEKEKKIASGVNYSEMITKEERISDETNALFKAIVEEKAPAMARYIRVLSKKIFRLSGERTVLVSLVRAGTPIGALVKRYFKMNNIDVPHYSISIIRGKGIDENALDYIREKHPLGKMVFIDGWTGKGSIYGELVRSINVYNQKNGTNIQPRLAVVADPACIAPISATHIDVCIPNACLNSTVSGLVSRSICNEKYIEYGDFHGAVCYEELKDQDMTNYFLDMISGNKKFNPLGDDIKSDDLDTTSVDDADDPSSKTVLDTIAKEYPMINPTKAKLSIGECSRAIIRRKPICILIRQGKENLADVKFVKAEAQRKEVPVESFPASSAYGKYTCMAFLK